MPFEAYFSSSFFATSPSSFCPPPWSPISTTFLNPLAIICSATRSLSDAKSGAVKPMVPGRLAFALLGEKGITGAAMAFPSFPAIATTVACAIRVWPPLTFCGPRVSVPPLYTSAVVLPSCRACLSSGQVIISRSTRALDSFVCPCAVAPETASMQIVDIQKRMASTPLAHSSKLPSRQDTTVRGGKTRGRRGRKGGERGGAGGRGGGGAGGRRDAGRGGAGGVETRGRGGVETRR